MKKSRMEVDFFGGEFGFHVEILETKEETVD